MQTTFTLTLDDDLIRRMDEARGGGVFLTRASFIRYLIDSALTEWERQQHG